MCLTFTEECMQTFMTAAQFGLIECVAVETSVAVCAICLVVGMG